MKKFWNIQKDKLMRQVQLFELDIYFFKHYLYNNIITWFPSYLLRVFYLRKILKYEIGKNTFIHLGCYFYGGHVKIGNNSVIGRCCVFNGDITIGDNTSITAHTFVQCISHDKDSPSFKGCKSPIIIGNRVWIGARAMILPGVTIGDGAILGAQSTLTKDIPPYTVFAGSPAKEVSKRSSNLDYELVYLPKFH